MNKKDFENLSKIAWSSEWSEASTEYVGKHGLVDHLCQWTEGNRTDPVKAEDFPKVVCLHADQDNRLSDSAEGIMRLNKIRAKAFHKLMDNNLLRVLWVDDGSVAVALSKTFCNKFNEWNNI
jgi:hypothetical protein